MIGTKRTIGRHEVVSSVEQGKLDQEISGELSHQYHRLLRLLGKIGTVNTCLTLTNSAIMNIIQTTVSSDTVVSIGSSTEPVYPTSLADNQKAELIPEYGVIIAHRRSTVPVFTDENGTIRTFVTVSRSTDNALYLENPDYLMENSVDHILDDSEPYLAQFVKDSMSKSNINIDIETTDQPFLINSLRFMPMPVVGSVLLESVYYNGVNPIVLNGETELSTVQDYTIQRTLPAYLHFEPVETSVLRLELSSTLYNSTLNAVCIGVSSVIGEFNTYAEYSYSGYEITAPEGVTLLKRITVLGNGYTESLDNIEVRVYTSLDEYNGMTSRYAVSGTTDRITSVPVPESGVMYLLVILTSRENTTPVITGVDLTFE